VLLTFGLGCWQTKRLFWKLQLIEDRKKQIHKEISTLDDVIAALTTTDADLENGQQDAHGRRVSLQGRWDRSNEALVGPRPPPKDLPQGFLKRGDTPGHFLVTPLVLEDGRRVLVNRGWIPGPLRSNKARTSVGLGDDGDLVAGSAPESAAPSGLGPLVTVDAIARLGEPVSTSTPVPPLISYSPLLLLFLRSFMPSVSRCPRSQQHLHSHSLISI